MKQLVVYFRSKSQRKTKQGGWCQHPIFFKLHDNHNRVLPEHEMAKNWKEALDTVEFYVRHGYDAKMQEEGS